MFPIILMITLRTPREIIQCNISHIAIHLEILSETVQPVITQIVISTIVPITLIYPHSRGSTLNQSPASHTLVHAEGTSNDSDNRHRRCPMCVMGPLAQRFSTPPSLFLKHFEVELTPSTWILSSLMPSEKALVKGDSDLIF